MGDAGGVGGPQQKKAGEVGRVVLDAGAQDLTAIDVGCVFARDRGDRSAGRDSMGGGSGSVIKGHRPQRWVGGKEASALGKRNRVGVDIANLVEPYTGGRDQVVTDAEQRLGDDLHRLGQQKVVVLKNRTGERVFNRDNGGFHFTGDKASKHLRGESAVDDLNRAGRRSPGAHLHGGFVTEGALFSLDGDTHGDSFSSFVPYQHTTANGRAATQPKLRPLQLTLSSG